MNLVSLLSLAALGALALCKVVAARRFHALRVVVLTLALWAVVFYLFTLAFPAPTSCCAPCCEPAVGEVPAFTCSGM